MVKVRALLFATSLLLLCLSLFGQGVDTHLSPEKAKVVALFWKGVERGEIVKGKWSFTEGELNSYFHFHKKELFTPNILLFRLRLLGDGVGEGRMVIAGNPTGQKALGPLFGSSTEVTMRMRLVSSGDFCYRLRIEKLTFGSVTLSAGMLEWLLPLLGDNFSLLLKPFCTVYPIRSLSVVPGRLLFILSPRGMPLSRKKPIFLKTAS